MHGYIANSYVNGANTKMHPTQDNTDSELVTVIL